MSAITCSSCSKPLTVSGALFCSHCGKRIPKVFIFPSLNRHRQNEGGRTTVDALSLRLSSVRIGAEHEADNDESDSAPPPPLYTDAVCSLPACRLRALPGSEYCRVHEAGQEFKNTTFPKPAPEETQTGDSDTLPRCTWIIKSGTRCKKSSLPGSTYCETHKAIPLTEVAEPGQHYQYTESCRALTTRKTRCTRKPLLDSLFCGYHQNPEEDIDDPSKLKDVVEHRLSYDRDSWVTSSGHARGVYLGVCKGTTKKGEPCKLPGANEGYCRFHSEQKK